MTSMIVPVWLSHEENPHKKRLVYAILDNQSDKSFILDKTAEDMNLHSTDVPLLMSTMLAENQLIQSSKIYGLSVRGFNNHKKIKLPAFVHKGYNACQSTPYSVTRDYSQMTTSSEIRNRNP